ncbi:MAG: acetyl-CoA decarbonylase/synthase complex subunit delta [Elusimicrobiota bacterium]
MVDKVIEKSASAISEVTLGALPPEGGTRGSVLKVGGMGVMPFHRFDGIEPHLPVVAVEVWDRPPVEEWPWFYEKYKDIVSNLIVWTKTAEEWGAEAICLRLASLHPDECTSYLPADIKKKIRAVLETTKLPLIIIGTGNNERDSDVLTLVCEETRGERCLVGMAVKENFKTIAAAAAANGHSIIAESPLDINLAKQLNILISDLGLGLDRIVMHHTTGGLGYGFEYCYSIMERTRIAGLQGDKIMGTPIINMIAQETWKVKESKDVVSSWGELDSRGTAWEIAATAAYLPAGADLVVVAHPVTVQTIKKVIRRFDGR